MGQASPFALNGLLEDIVQQYAPDARKGGLELTFSVAAGVPLQLRGDLIKLWQILTNLVSNAIKFSERGKIALSAGLESETNSSAVVRFTVTDTGIGIPEEMRPAIFQFQPFAQLGSSIQYGGFGLGLATCKRLAELMGGEIGFESALGQGSSFWCKVPLEKQAQADSTMPFIREEALPAAPVPEVVAAPASEPAAAPPMKSRLSRFSVLVASPEQVYATQVMFDVYKLGYEVDVATDCQQMLEALSRFPYGLVLADSSLPEGEVFSAISEIRRREKDKLPTPLLLMLESARQTSRSRFLEAGFDDVIDKPVRAASLAGVLAKWDVPVDSRTLAMLRGIGKGGIEDDTVRVFLSDGPRALEKMRKAADIKDMKGFKQEAELLSRMGGSVGAKGVRALCFKMGMLGDSWPDKEAKSLLDELEGEFSRARATLEEQRVPVPAPVKESVEEGAAKAREATVPIPTMSKSKPDEIKILLCDDDVLQTSLLMHFLERLQFPVLTANDGMEGLALVRKEKPNLMILDMGMPMKTGMEVLEELSKEKDQESLPYIIILSNYESDHIVNQAKSLGADEVLTKPVNPAALRKKIQELIQQGKI